MKQLSTRILYLDANENDRLQVRDILQQEAGAFEVTVAGSSEEFEALLRDKKFDLILCDVNVPGLSGLDALEKVKAFNPKLPVIILTGSQNGQLGVGSIQLGAADLIIKSPATLSILTHKIRMVMDKIQVDEKRWESDIHYNDIISRVPMGVYLYRLKPDGVGKFEYVNPRFCEFLGLTAEEVLTDTDRANKAIHPEDRENLKWAKSEAVEAGQFFAWEGRITGGGELRWVRIESEPMSLPDGDILWNGVVMNITGRKSMEDRILQNEAIFTSFLENSPVYVFFKDRDIRTLRLSSNYEQMLGIPVSQALGKTMDELFPSELSKSMIADDLRILNEGKRVNVVEELNGHIYETTKFPIFKEGKPDMLAGFTLDITERMQAERLLHKSEAFNQAIISESPIGIAAFSKTGEVFFGNNAWRKIWGYSEEEYQEVLQYKYAVLVFEELDEYVKDHFDQVRQVYEQGGSLYLPDLRIPNARPGGAEWVSEYYYAIIDEQGQVERIVTLTEDISIRKKAEQALRNSENFNQALIALSPIGIAVFNNTGTPLFGNMAWRKIWGFSEEEYQKELQREFEELGFDEWDEYLQGHIDQVRQVYAQGGSLSLPDLKITNQRPGGAEWVSQYYYAIMDEQGRVERIITMTEDISARKKAEEEIIKSRALLERVQQVAQLGSVEIDLTAQTVIASAMARHIYGWEEDVLSLANVQAFALPEYRAEINAALDKMIHLKQEFNIQYKIERKSDGAIRDIHAMAEYNPDENKVVGSIQDITDRKLIMQVLMENEEKFRTLFEHANDAILIFNANDRILDANKLACVMFGYSRDELLKMNVTDLQAPELRGTIYTTLKDEFKIFGNRIFESVDVRKDGTTFAVEITLSKITIARGVRFFGIVRDVSERKRIELELKEQIDTLERIQDVTVGRELRMIELKKEINALLLKAGGKEKYNIFDL